MGPGFRFGRWVRCEPHGGSEDFGGVCARAGDVKEAVFYAPVAAEGERHAVADGGELGRGGFSGLWSEVGSW